MTNHEITHVSEVKDIRILCSHRFEGGNHCGSPALRGETYCYYHHPTRRPTRETRTAWRIARRNFSIPTPTNPEQSLDAISHVLQAILDNRVKLTRARRILYSLELTSHAFREGVSQKGLSSTSSSGTV